MFEVFNGKYVHDFIHLFLPSPILELLPSLILLGLLRDFPNSRSLPEGRDSYLILGMVLLFNFRDGGSKQANGKMDVERRRDGRIRVLLGFKGRNLFRRGHELRGGGRGRKGDERRADV